jgi:uncharacterized membrane protein
VALSIVAILIGAFIGAAVDEGTGVLIGALVGWLLVRSLRQQRAIDALQQAIRQRSAEGPAAQATVPAEAALIAPVAPATAVPVPIDAPAALPADPTWPEPGVEPIVAALAAEPAVPAATPALPPQPGLLAPLRDWFFGGNTIVKAGIGILFVGLAFLAKYASEHVQLPIELRLAAIGAAAIVLLFFGWRLRRSRPGYGQVLQGGAVAVLYLTLFVAFRFYGVLAVGPVFALMVVVAALAAALAVLQDAMALAVIGALGGFATPLLVSTGSGDQVALFSYYLVLVLGIAAVAWFRTWRVLNLVGFAFTFIVGSAWGVLKYSPADYASSQGFLIAFFLLFIAILLMPARRAETAAPRGADRWVNGTLLFGLPTVVFALQYGLVRDTEYGSALSALALAAFYVLLALWMRSRPALALVFEGSLAVGTVFLTLVIPFALDARSTAGAWALEGAGLVWLGFRQARRLPRAFGYLLLVFAGASLLYASDRFGAPATVFNALLFNGVMLAAGALAAAYFVQRHALPAAREGDVGERVAEPLLIGWAILWCAVTAAIHIDALVPPLWRLAALLASASGVALACTALCARLDWRHVAFPVLALAPLLLFGVAVSALFQPSPLRHGGWWVWPLAFAVHLATLRWAAPAWPAAGRHLAHALGVLVLAWFGALCGRVVTKDWGDTATAWAWLGWLVVPALLLALLPRPATARRWPVSALPPAYRTSAAAVIALGLLLWTLLANIVSNGAARPLPHVPLLNPLDLGIAAALVACWAWSRSEAASGLFAARPTLAPALLGASGFVWLNAMLVRAFHHWGEVPFRFSAWTDTLAVQTGITLLWTATALVLMWLAARQARRAPWLVGAALLAAVVLKLLLVDLSGTGTVTRIVSFIGVGVLMLVIGYVAPLPAPKEKAHAAA